MNHKIIDNFLDNDVFSKLFIYLTTPQATAWYQNDNLGTINFSHLLFSNMRINSEKFELIRPLIEKLQVKALLRASAYLYFQTAKIEKIKPILHYDFDHMSAIFFLNTNNGYIMLDDKNKIQAVENRVVVYPTKSLTLITNCTNNLHNATIELDYF